jgi:hypothetical protein
MGRWTPLVLMAGGLAILLGTLLGINFPMGGQNAQAPRQAPNRASSVLPANINVNSTTTGSNTTAQNRTSVAQSNSSTPSNNANNGNDPNAGDTNIDQSQSSSQSSSQSNSNNTGNSGPIRALW